MGEKLKILHVAVLPPGPFDCCLDYLPPQEDVNLRIGTRVRVPLGKNQRVGVVVGESDRSVVALKSLKRVVATIDEIPLLSDNLLRLLEWTASYYHYPINQVLFQTLPALVCKGEPLQEAYSECWSLVEGVSYHLPERAYRQQQMVDFLQERGMLDEALLNERFDNWKPIIKSLLDKGMVVSQPSVKKGKLSTSPHKLNEEQLAVIAAISGALGSFSCQVLEGITGSGKTEVYLHVAEKVIANNQQVLILVPEIGLTGPTVQQFQERFGEVVEVLHSGMTPKQRLVSWSRVHSGNAKVIVGPRSAVFAPLLNPGLIVIDEEHDLSYKQQDTLRYHARDLAVKRAKLIDIPVILGSATLSLETLCHVRNSHYQHRVLKQRVLDAQLPSYQIIDLCGRRLEAGLSPELKAMIHVNLERGEQTLLFLNRRGYAPKLLCHDCGIVAECPECEVPFTYHLYDHSLRCHHCDSYQPQPTQCNQCGSDKLQAIGVGTERVEESLEKIFPEANVVRIDSDSTKRKGEFEQRFEQARSGQAGILVGTQMISKGHHFPKVTLVGILGLDQKLFSTDFRALERLGQLVIQVSGRAGRSSTKSIVALQTHHPTHSELQSLVKLGYSSFADRLLEQRKMTAMPPYRYLAVFRADAKRPDQAHQFLEFVAREVKHHAIKTMEVLGPMPMMMEKRAGFYRAQLLLFADHRRDLRQCLMRTLPVIRTKRPRRDFAWHLDIDPMELE